MAKSFEQLVIDQEYISIFGSGPSLLEMSPDDLNFLYENTFIFGINFAHLRFKTHALIWADRNVTKEVEEYYAIHEKDRLFIASHVSFAKDTKWNADNVDYQYKTGGKIKGGFTGIWLMQLLQEIAPCRPILLFGFDQKVKENCHKWHWNYRKMNDHMAREKTKLQGKFAMFQDQCQKFIGKQPYIHNCTPGSKLETFQKSDFRDVIQL